LTILGFQTFFYNIAKQLNAQTYSTINKVPEQIRIVRGIL